ncbi:MAG TPA: tripartite tricarboxylate transporter substrate-binding protein [Burkholderiales bacterium]|nr:tripartite tricarboxylate transporter substrate-binding protein [Burkholderiales bacterium]
MKNPLLVCGIVALGCTCTAVAQNYPTRPLSIVVPFPAGGPTDTIARIMAERMTRSLGQTVLVENSTGAGGTIGVGKVARAAPDGYTVGIGHIGTHVINGAIYQLPYDLQKDFEPIAMIASNPQIFVSKNAVPVKNLKELIVWVKANQDKVTIATGGPGTPSHVSGVYFQKVTSTQPQIVHYRGGAPAMQDLLGGQIDLFFDQAATALPQIRGGRIKPYAVTAKTRLLAAPEIPTTDEAGLPGFYMEVWHGIWLPSGASKTVAARLNAAILEALADPAVRQRLADLGQEVPPREQQSPEVLRAHHKAEIDKWWPVIKAAGIKVE